MNPLKAGDIAPKFSLPDQDGEQVNLTDFQGQRVLVYFYPKAMPTFLEKLLDQARYSTRPPEILLTHPLPESRLSDARNRANQMRPVVVQSSQDFYMADADGNSLIAVRFPAGSSEVFVPAGTFLDFMGNFSGTAGQPVGVHLHFSIVRDDGSGHFTNELQISNTLDPSPYLGLPLNAEEQPALPILCSTQP